MSIIDEFDPHSVPLFTPKQIYGECEPIARICVVTFHHKVTEKVLSEHFPREVAAAFTANGRIPIYRLEKTDPAILFYMSPIGAPAAGAVLEEVHTLTGASHFVVFGSAGVLDSDRCRGKILIPTESYRDEGLSYHYAPSADYIRMKNSEKLADFFSSRGVPYLAGRNWTTDAIYRETVDRIARHRADGCISVEMEAAGLEAVADAVGAELYTFFFGGDILGERWEIGNIGGEKEKKKQESLFDLALDFAKTLS